MICCDDWRVGASVISVTIRRKEPSDLASNSIAMVSLPTTRYETASLFNRMAKSTGFIFSDVTRNGFLGLLISYVLCCSLWLKERKVARMRKYPSEPRIYYFTRFSVMTVSEPMGAATNSLSGRILQPTAWLQMLRSLLTGKGTGANQTVVTLRFRTTSPYP